MDRSTGIIPWSSVVTQIKNYAKANDNIADVGVGQLHRPVRARVPARRREQQPAASRPRPSSFPAPSSASRRRQRQLPPGALPSSTVKSFFSKAIGNGDLTVGATSTAKVVFTVTASQTTTLVAGGPCALCILSPTGLTLDGQNGDVTITDGNVVVNSTVGHRRLPEPQRPREDHDRRWIDRRPRELRPGGVQQLLRRRVLSGMDATRSGHRPAGQRSAVRQRLARAPPTTARPSRGPTAPTAARCCPASTPTIKNSHTLSPGIYVLKGDITLNGNDLVQGDGVMLYFACSNYPSPCRCRADRRAGIKATGNGAHAHHRHHGRRSAPTTRTCARTSA